MTVAVLALGLAACNKNNADNNAAERDCSREHRRDRRQRRDQRRYGNAADNALNAAGNAVENAGNAVDNAQRRGRRRHSKFALLSEYERAARGRPFFFARPKWYLAE